MRAKRTIKASRSSKVAGGWYCLIARARKRKVHRSVPYFSTLNAAREFDRLARSTLDLLTILRRVTEAAAKF
jgi:hypothetical protein